MKKPDMSAPQFKGVDWLDGLVDWDAGMVAHTDLDIGGQYHVIMTFDNPATASVWAQLFLGEIDPE